MFSCDHNGVISMDATFGTNDMKFRLFTLMGFDVHHIGVPLARIITSQKMVEDLFKWLRPLKAKMLSCIPNWNVPIFLCCWHVLKAWWLHATKKIKDVEV
jgi:hypothetical protein